MDTVWRILTEERSDGPRSSRKTRGKGKEKEGHLEGDDEGWMTLGGIGQLYHGLGMNMGAVFVVSMLAALAGGQEAEAGWAEL